MLLHGFMEDMSMWTHITPALAHKTCIEIDLHGHGNSFFNPDLAPSISEMATQVQHLLTHLGVHDYQLVGHSMGGYVGCELLKKDPDMEHLILLHSHPWADAPGKKLDRNRVIELVRTRATFFIREAVPNLFAFPQHMQAVIARYCAVAEKMNPEAIAWASAAMRDRSSYTALLEQDPGRVSIIQGQLDPLIPNLQLRAFATQAGVGFHEIPECGHMGQEEQPEAVREWLKVILG